MPRHPRDVETWFWKKVDRSAGPDGCWPWTGAIVDPKRGVNGTYGRVWAWGRQTTAHRVALALHLGRDITPGLFVLHGCNNPPCCNPAHLREGTAKDNAMDFKLSKGRVIHTDPAEKWEWTIRAERDPTELDHEALALALEAEARLLPTDSLLAEGAERLAIWNRQRQPVPEPRYPAKGHGRGRRKR